MTVPIHVHDLHKSFPPRTVLAGVNLEVGPSSIFGLLGRNGSGKTTLLRALMGLVVPDRGTARVLGSALHTGCPSAKTEVAYVAQGEVFPRGLSLRALVSFEAVLRPWWSSESLDSWLARSGLNLDQRADMLSVGQRKRFEIELALAGQPTVLLMDEPFAGLDPVARTEALEAVLAHVSERPLTVLLSSHILSDLERVCDHIGILAGGRIDVVMTMDELKERTFVVSSPDGLSGLGIERPEHGLNGATHRVFGSRSTVVASRPLPSGHRWVVRDLGDAEAARLRAAGAQVAMQSLDEMGTELLRCLER